MDRREKLTVRSAVSNPRLGQALLRDLILTFRMVGWFQKYITIMR